MPTRTGLGEVLGDVNGWKKAEVLSLKCICLATLLLTVFKFEDFDCSVAGTVGVGSEERDRWRLE